jgi:hypothetical protein
MLRQFTTTARKHHPKLALGLPPSTIHNISITSAQELKEPRGTKISNQASHKRESYDSK